MGSRFTYKGICKVKTQSWRGPVWDQYQRDPGLPRGGHRVSDTGLLRSQDASTHGSSQLWSPRGGVSQDLAGPPAPNPKPSTAGREPEAQPRPPGSEPHVFSLLTQRGSYLRGGPSRGTDASVSGSSGSGTADAGDGQRPRWRVLCPCQRGAFRDRLFRAPQLVVG